MLVLGIESSCDETALALVRDGALSDAVLASQADMHALFGGVSSRAVSTAGSSARSLTNSCAGQERGPLISTLWPSRGGPAS